MAAATGSFFMPSPGGRWLAVGQTDEGKADGMHPACGDDVSDGVLFSGEKYPKAARGATGADRLYKPYAPVSPWYPLSGMRPAAVGFNYPPSLKAVACRFGALCAVPVSPEQCYPPRLVSSCNSSVISMPHQVSAFYFSPCPTGSRPWSAHRPPPERRLGPGRRPTAPR